MLPNFLVIGSQKSATTWLYFRLKEHPDIFLPDTKEIGFFNEQNEDLSYNEIFDKLGLPWYKNFFRHYSNQKAIGEVTPIYICDKSAHVRIARTLGQSKIIAILRNPVSRAYSHYWMAVGKGQTEKSFEQLIDENNERFIKRGLYYEQLKNYYDTFDSKNIMVILMEELYKNKQQTLKDIYQFLGVDVDFVSDTIEQKENSSFTIKYPKLNQMLEDTILAFRKNRLLSKLVDVAKETGIAERVLRLSKKQVVYPDLPDNVHFKLTEYYKESNQKLSELINKDVSIWDKKK